MVKMMDDLPHLITPYQTVWPPIKGLNESARAMLFVQPRQISTHSTGQITPTELAAFLHVRRGCLSVCAAGRQEL